MKFRRYLQEMTFTKTPIEVTKNTEKEMTIEFEIDDGTYKYSYDVLFKRTIWGTPEWEVEFRYTHIEPFPEGRIPFPAIKVFAGVGTALQKFIKLKNPGVFHFTPATSKLATVYEKFVKLILKAFPNYKYEGNIGHHRFVRKDYNPIEADKKARFG